jgi:high-affinity iron transporter
MQLRGFARSRPWPGLTLAFFLLAFYILAALGFVIGRGISVRSEDRFFPAIAFPAEDLVPDPTAIPAARGEERPPVDLAAAMRPGPEALARGEGLYSDTCASCHGPEGRGDGPAAAGLDPPARDFTVPEGWRKSSRITDLFRTLTVGIPGSSMAAYDYIAPEDRFALAHHVRSLGDFAQPADSPAAVAALDEEYRLSEGVREPNRVPVALALERMAVARSSDPLVLPPAWTEGERGELFRLAVQDPERAAGTLAASGAWRRDVPSLARLARGGAPANGFAPAAATLSPREWALLQETLEASLAGGER